MELIELEIGGYLFLILVQVLLGEQEEQNDTVAVRKHSEGDLGSMSVAEFSELINTEIQENIVEFNV